jgi:predicted dehydrogenase
VKKELRVAIIGHNFMGRVHSNAWLQAPRFFNLGRTPVLKVACGRDRVSVEQFAQQWGWRSVETSWQKVIERDDVDVVDISLPQNLHHEVAIAAARAGKHVFCEKPMAVSVAEAEAMLLAAEQARITHYINHNYRRCPAVRLAKQLIDAGEIGTVYHWRSAYQQDWIMDPEFPLTWHLRREVAGSGPQGDLNSHSVDLAHYLIGEIRTVSCLTANFIKSRPLPGDGAATISAGSRPSLATRAQVTVEDASLMMVEFANGAVGSFEATRFAGGRKNHHTFEVYGSEGSLVFDLERMNELEFYSRRDPEGVRGFRTILATERSHPYMSRWWPPGHLIGYEHGFVHAVAEFVEAISQGVPAEPNFADGLKCMKVLDAGLRSAASGERVSLS